MAFEKRVFDCTGEEINPVLEADTATSEKNPIIKGNIDQTNDNDISVEALIEQAGNDPLLKTSLSSLHKRISFVLLNT